MDINQELAEYYSLKWRKLCSVLDENELKGYEYNPLLLGVNNPNDFEKADVKVMLFGQDMSLGDWYKYDRNAQVLKECMLSIKTFDNKIGAISNGIKQTRGMGGGMNLFINKLNSNFKDKEIRYIWNDLVKIGRNIKWNNKKEILESIEDKYFNVLKDEINIIQPQVIIFFTGPQPYWELRLQKKIGITDENYKNISNWNNIKQVALLDLDKTKFPSVKYAFRTYHPCARVAKKDMYSAIIENIIL